ncbi:MAG TPA: methyl-accepting chemotaxis protein, partial [Candidatus Aquicultor sp.]
MKFIKSRRMGDLLLGSIIAMLIPLLVVSYFGYSGIQGVGNGAGLLQDSMKDMGLIDNYQSLLHQYHTDLYRLVYLKDGSKVAECTAISNQISKIVEEFKVAAKNGEIDPKVITDIETTREAFRAVAKPIFTGYKDKEFATAQLAKADKLFDPYLNAVRPLDGVIADREKLANKETGGAQSVSERNIILAILFGLLATGALAALTQLWIIKPMRESFTKVEATSQRLSGSSQELSANADAMSQATAQVTSAISQVATGAAEQSKNSQGAVGVVDSIARAIEQVSTSTQNQVTSISEMANGINKLIGSIEEVTASANEVADVVDSASSVATKGKGAVDDTVSGMERIKETVLSS